MHAAPGTCWAIRPPKFSEVALTPEVELLLCCSRTQVGPRAAGRMGSLLRGPIDWEEFLRIVAAHGVLPLVYESLAGLNWPAAPAAVQQKLHHSFALHAGKILLLSRHLVELLEWLEEADIPAVPFKGPVLAALAYGDVIHRECGDLDILVHERDAARAAALLEQQGYRLQGSGKIAFDLGAAEFLQPASGVRVELHWEFNARRFVFPLRAEDVWPRVRPADFQGHRILAFSPEDTFLYLTLHGAKHCWSSLKWICDLAELVRAAPSLDWDAILQRAGEIGATRSCMLAMYLAVELLEAAVPAGLVRTDSVVLTLAQRVEERLKIGTDAPGLESVLMNLRLRERLCDRVRLFSLQMTQRSGEEERWVRLPGGLDFLYVLVRPAWLLRSYGRELLRLQKCRN
jgi:hypothetical protein